MKASLKDIMTLISLKRLKPYGKNIAAFYHWIAASQLPSFTAVNESIVKPSYPSNITKSFEDMYLFCPQSCRPTPEKLYVFFLLKKG